MFQVALNAWNLALLAASRATNLLLGPHTTAILTEVRQGRYLMDKEDLVIGGELRWRGRWALDELDLELRFIDRETDVLVVGGHVGTLAVPMSRVARAVTAIEANPTTYGYLTANLHLNRATNVEAVHIAASDAPGTIDFVANRLNTGTSKRKPRRSRFGYRLDAPATIAVEAARLDDLLAGRDYGFILMDIEGSEYFALRGMPRLLGAADVLGVEFNQQFMRDVAGVDAREWLAPIAPHFRYCYVPSRRRLLTIEEAARFLPGFRRWGNGEPVLLFTKRDPTPELRAEGTASPLTAARAPGARQD